MIGRVTQPNALPRVGMLTQAAKAQHGMTLPNTLTTAWEGIMVNKLRSFLTTLGIIIGVAAVIIMLAVSAGAEAAIADQINGLGANLLLVNPLRAFGGVRGAGGGGGGQGGGDGQGRVQGGGGQGGGGQGGSVAFVYDDVQAIVDNVANIVGVSVEQPTTQDVRWGSTNLTGIAIVGTNEDFLLVRDYQLASGRFFTAADLKKAALVTVLGHGIAQDLFAGQAPIGQQIRIGSTRFTVIGVMAEQGMVGATDNDGRLYIPITAVFKKFTRNRVGGNQVRTIMVKGANEEVMSQLGDDLRAFLAERRHVDPAEPNFNVSSQQDIVKARASTTAAFRNLLAWVAGVSLVVGGIGIMNIMLVSVTERTREIGLRQALGARPRDVQRQFLFEAVMLSLFGGLVGVCFGVAGSYLFGLVGGMRTELVPLSLPLAFLASATVGIFFGYYPATQAAKLDPIEALRRE